MEDLRPQNGLVFGGMPKSFQAQLAELARLFGSNRRAAEFIGLTHSRFPAWMGGELPSERSLERIVDGAAVVKELRDRRLTDAEILTELHSLWSELNARPAELVRAGGAATVIEAIATRYATPQMPDATDELAAALRLLAQAAAASADALVKSSR